MLLEQRKREQESRFPRVPAASEGHGPGSQASQAGGSDGQMAPEPPIDLEEVQVWDLLEVFSRLMAELGARTPRLHEIVYDDTPIELHAADIEDRLQREGKLTLRALVMGRKSRSEMIGVFLALLELMRQKKVLVTQAQDLGDLQIALAGERAASLGED